MEDKTNIKNIVDTFSKKLQDTVMALSQSKVSPPMDVEMAYEMIHDHQRFLIDSSTELYEVANQVGNVVEDHIRSVYLFTDDATLEGHATELETQLGQLRILSEGIKSLASEYNDEMREVIRQYFELMGGKYLFESKDSETMQLHRRKVCQIFFLKPIYLKTVDTYKNYRETSIKMLSVLAMTIGRWEAKIEDKVGAEDISEGMVMTNVTLRRSKKKKVKDNSGFYN
jgi:hypothetical protein